MEDNEKERGRKNLIPPPFTIKILTKPPYYIDLSPDKNNEDANATQSNSNQNVVSTALEMTDDNPTEVQSAYASITRNDISPSSLPTNSVQQHSAHTTFLDERSSQFGRYPFDRYNEEDVRKLAYEQTSAFISISKKAAEESLKTQALWDRSQIKINENIEEATIAVNRQKLLYASEYEHTKNMNGLKTKGVVEIGSPKNNAMMTRYITDFIHDFQIVALTVKFGMKSNFYCLETSKGIKVGHAPIDEKTLENLFKKFLRKVVGEAANSYKFSDLFTELKDLIPILQSKDCDLTRLKEEEQIFNNGVYNVRESSFYEFNDNERIFGQFPVNVDFTPHDINVFPFTIFDEILDDVFDSDMEKINLLYQILGAIMSNISLKHIFVFQGKSGGGKTTLTDIICEIVGTDKCYPIFDLSNLRDCTPEELNSYKLVVVKDAADKAITPKQLILLKNFADGAQQSSLSNFKVIINTNNSVYTFKDSETGVKRLNKALANRLVVLPFEKVMSKTYSKIDCDEYIRQNLHDERAYIISKAFIMFSYYYKIGENNRQVCRFYGEDFHVNAVIEDEVEIV